MTLDSPDYHRGIVAARLRLGQFASGTVTADIALPAAVTAIWVWIGPGVNNVLPTATGTVTGIHYPVYVVGQDPTANIPPFIAPVDPALDPAVTVDWGAAPAAGWWVVGDTSFRVAGALQLVLTARAV